MRPVRQERTAKVSTVAPPFTTPERAATTPAKVPSGYTGRESATVVKAQRRPHERNKASFGTAFARVLGPGAVSRLMAKFSDAPILVLSGDQLTGKSTVAKAIAKALGGEASSTGSLVRAQADQLQIPIEAMTKRLAEHPSANVELDYRAAETIAAGDVIAFESRIAGHLGRYLSDLGRPGVLSVYLTASPRERTLRYLAREVGPDARERIESQLQVPADATLVECLDALGSIDDPAARAVHARFEQIAGRDEVLQGELQSLYGIDYRDHDGFDLVIDTSRSTHEATLAKILGAMGVRDA